MARRVPTERRGGPLDGLHLQIQARLIEYMENYAPMVFWKTIKFKESSLEVSTERRGGPEDILMASDKGIFCMYIFYYPYLILKYFECVTQDN